jgi:predicted neuraminidase
MNIKKAEKEYIFFRDESLFKDCHASTLIQLPNGDILTSWFGGSKEAKPDVAIWCSKRHDGKWSAPKKVADKENLVHWNPVLHLNKNGEIMLFYKVGHPIPEWYTMLIVSKDGGETWSEPIELVKGDIGGRGPVKNKAIELLDGTIVAPASIETKDPDIWDAFVDISYDEGITWTKSNIVPLRHQVGEEEDKVEEDPNYCHRKGVIQPTLWESEPGKVHMLLRSTGARIYRSDSEDGGKTWGPAYATVLPNNNSGIDLVKAENALFLVYNPVKAYKGVRTPLSLAMSLDNGETWRDVIVLENDEGEYSYPAIIYKDQKLYVTYTWKRERIVYWEISLEM